MYRPVFTIHGNKRKMVPILQDEIDALPEPYTQYVELFGGSLSLLTNIDLPKSSTPVIVNDFDKGHYQFYKMVKNYPDYVLDSIDYWVQRFNKKNNQKAFKDMHKAYLDGDVSVLPILSRTTFFSTVNNKNPTMRTDHSISMGLKEQIKDSIIQLHNQLKNGKAKIYNMDMSVPTNIQKIVKDIKPGAFVFLDPPYIESSNHQYGHSLGNDGNGFVNLLYAIHNKGAYFLLTNIENKYSKKIYKNLKIPTNYRTVKLSSKYNEIIVTNY